MIRSLILRSLFQFMLNHSGWRYAEVAASEFYPALQWGLQGALWNLSGAPQRAEESEVLFTFVAERYELYSLSITSTLIFSQWEHIFPNPMATAAAIDWVVTIPSSWNSMSPASVPTRPSSGAKTRRCSGNFD